MRARFEAGEVVEEGVVRVRPGALARFTLEPALVDPGDRVRATARFQLAVGAAELRVGERVYPLARADRWTWTAELAAPPGSRAATRSSCGRTAGATPRRTCACWNREDAARRAATFPGEGLLCGFGRRRQFAAGDGQR